MLTIKIVISAVCLILLAAAVVCSNIRRKRKNRLQAAAYDIMKEEALNNALKNKHRNSGPEDKQKKKQMIHIETKHVNPVISHVFNPETPVVIGRNGKECTICLRDASVSGRHCTIFVRDEQIRIQDLNSSNKTRIKRKGKTITLNSMEAELVHNKDIVTIGTVNFKISLFETDVFSF